MSNVKTFGCASCGAQLNLNNVRNGQVACEYCGSINLIERITQNAQILDKQNINSGFELIATKAVLHRRILNILAQEPFAPLDVFENVKIIKEERICLPVFMYSVSATANFMFEQGIEKKRQEPYSTKKGIKYRTVTYTDWMPQTSAVSVTGVYFSPGSKAYSKLFADFSRHLDVSGLIDVEELQFPSDVIMLEFNYPMAASYAEYVDPLVESAMKQRAESALAGRKWRNGQMQGTSARKDEVQRVYYPFYHIIYEYNEQSYDVYVSHDGNHVHYDRTVIDPNRQAKAQQFQDAIARIKTKGIGRWIGLIAGGLALSMIIISLFAVLAESIDNLAIDAIGFVSGMLLFSAAIVFPLIQIIKLKKNSNQLKAAERAKLGRYMKEYTDRRDVFLDKKVALHGIYESVSGDASAFILD